MRPEEKYKKDRTLNTERQIVETKNKPSLLKDGVPDTTAQ